MRREDIVAERTAASISASLISATGRIALGYYVTAC